MKIIGLDVGTRRIGVAIADSSVRIAVPKTTITVNNGLEFTEITRLARMNNTEWFIVGLPRNNEGKETAQSKYAREFAETLKTVMPNAKIRFQDESLTSVEAENRLKSRKRTYQKGEIDAEAASIILQDFIEHLSMTSDDANATNLAPAGRRAKSGKAAKTAKSNTARSSKSARSVSAATQSFSNNDNKKGNSMLKKFVVVLLIILVALGIGGGVAFSWYSAALSPYYDVDCSKVEEDDTRCELVNFTVEQGATLPIIADNLEAADIIKSSIAFQIYVRSQGYADQIKIGEYQFRRDMSVPDIANQLKEGAKNPNVFSFTILPGETVKEIKADLLETGNYTESEIKAAFAKNYRGTNSGIDRLLESLPNSFEPNAEPLEGYLFGDTYEFYKSDTVEKIIITALDAMWQVVEGNNLIEKYESHNLSLHQGITLASIVQRESGSAASQSTVAQIFYSRISQNIPLGSDVTTKYALDLVNPNRDGVVDNGDALEVDSPYNTRKYQGLPPGPICNPGISALLAVANPADTSYLYFLTGDDGMMYYSYTEEEHNQNIVEHCRELCNVAL